jgi:hypothetical protein
MHTGYKRKVPLNGIIFSIFVEPDPAPNFRMKIGRVLIGTSKFGLGCWQLVPVFTGNLAGFTTNT